MRRRTVLTVAGGALAGGIGLAAAGQLNDSGDGATAPDSWPQIGHDARHTRHVPGARGPRDDATVTWQRLGDRPVYPPVVDDALYLPEA